jgi:hypothetical protein
MMEVAMPRVVFTANLQRHVSAPPSEVAGRTVRAALEAVFTANPRLRNYVLDDKGRVRHHVVEDYGGRGFSCRDLEGRLWNFGTYDPWKTHQS